MSDAAYADDLDPKCCGAHFDVEKSLLTWHQCNMCLGVGYATVFCRKMHAHCRDCAESCASVCMQPDCLGEPAENRRLEENPMFESMRAGYQRSCAYLREARCRFCKTHVYMGDIDRHETVCARRVHKWEIIRLTSGAPITTECVGILASILGCETVVNIDEQAEAVFQIGAMDQLYYSRVYNFSLTLRKDGMLVSTYVPFSLSLVFRDAEQREATVEVASECGSCVRLMDATFRGALRIVKIDVRTVRLAADKLEIPATPTNYYYHVHARADRTSGENIARHLRNSAVFATIKPKETVYLRGTPPDKDVILLIEGVCLCLMRPFCNYIETIAAPRNSLVIFDVTTYNSRERIVFAYLARAGSQWKVMDRLSTISQLPAGGLREWKSIRVTIPEISDVYTMRRTCLLRLNPFAWIDICMTPAFGHACAVPDHNIPSYMFSKSHHLAPKKWSLRCVLEIHELNEYRVRHSVWLLPGLDGYVPFVLTVDSYIQEAPPKLSIVCIACKCSFHWTLSGVQSFFSECLCGMLLDPAVILNSYAANNSSSLEPNKQQSLGTFIRQNGLPKLMTEMERPRPSSAGAVRSRRPSLTTGGASVLYARRSRSSLNMHVDRVRPTDGTVCKTRKRLKEHVERETASSQPTYEQNVRIKEKLEKIKEERDREARGVAYQARGAVRPALPQRSVSVNGVL